MKQVLLPLLLLLWASELLSAKPVDPVKAQQVATNFYLAKAGGSVQTSRARSLPLVYTSVSQLSDPQARMKPTAYYYVFNAGTQDGFVIVAADDKASPILG